MRNGGYSVISKCLRLLVAALLTVFMGTVVAACGDDEESSGSSSNAEATATQEPAKEIKVGMVTDIGGLNDRGFNQLAYQGLKRAESELGADIRVLTSKSNADYVPNLSTLRSE